MCWTTKSGNHGHRNPGFRRLLNHLQLLGIATGLDDRYLMLDEDRISFQQISERQLLAEDLA